MKYLLSFVLMAFVLIISSCDNKNSRNSEIYNEKFTIKNFNEISEKIAKDNSIPEKDVDALIAGLKRLTFVKDSIAGKTVKQVIENEELFERDLRNNALKNISDISILRLNTENKYLGVTPSKDQSGIDVNNLFFTFSNKFDKGIKTLSGEIVFYYLEPGQKPMQMKPIPFQYTREIKPNSQDTIIMMQRYLENDDFSKMIRNNTNKLTGSLNITNVEFVK
jgi:hypothetical protein